MNRVVHCGVLLATLGLAIAKPQIVSSPELVTVYTGQAVMFRCQVYDPQNTLMSWSSVTHNLTIYDGSRLLVKDDTRYSLIHVAGGQQYNLQILNVVKSDEGFYKCAIEGTDQKLISQLRVLDMPSTAGTSKITYSSNSMITVPHTVPTEASSTTAASRIPNSSSSTPSETQPTRSYNIPTKLTVITSDGTLDVLLTWDMDQSTDDTRFTVFFRTLSEVQYTAVSNIATPYYLLTELKPQTFYTAYVVARESDNPDSPPSKQVQFVSGYNSVPNDKADKATGSDDDNLMILAIGIGVTVAAVILIVMVLLAVFIIFKRKQKGSMEFADQSFSHPTSTIKY